MILMTFDHHLDMCYMMLHVVFFWSPPLLSFSTTSAATGISAAISLQLANVNCIRRANAWWNMRKSAMSGLASLLSLIEKLSTVDVERCGKDEGEMM